VSVKTLFKANGTAAEVMGKLQEKISERTFEEKEAQYKLLLDLTRDFGKDLAKDRALVELNDVTKQILKEKLRWVSRTLERESNGWDALVARNVLGNIFDELLR